MREDQVEADSIIIPVPLSREGLADFQARHAEHVVFNMTAACPLRCAHCSVQTLPASDRSRTLPMPQAITYADQMSALAARGIKFVSFTGGEPLLARKQIEVMARAAHAAGIECHITTACHWAGTEESAARVIQSLPEISCWHLSTDTYHTEFVSIDNVIRAARAARQFDRHVVLRLATTIPETAEIHAIHTTLKAELPGLPIHTQPVMPIGRGADLATTIELAELPAWPCMPVGMVVRYDGTIAPCCSGLYEAREGHPFDYPNANDVGLAGAHHAWCTDPLLQLIRAAGFGALIAWIEEVAPDHPVLANTPRHVCDFCTQLWEDRSVGPALRERLAAPDARRKVADLVEAVFGETFMKDELVQTLQ